MTLDQLKYFYEAARFQHVGRAARFVHISPSAVSSAIASLESELRCVLFERQGKSIVLTDPGKRLKEEAEKLFDQISEMKETLQGKAKQFHGSYRLGASHFLAPRFLSKAWGEIQNSHSELVGEICSLPTSQVLDEVVSGVLDAGLCFSPVQHPQLSQKELHRGQLVVAVRSGHPLLKLRGRAAIGALAQFPAVIHKGQPGVDLCEAHPIFAQYGIVPDIRFQFDSDDCAVQRVMTSDSWAFIPDLVANCFPRKIHVISHPSDWDAHYTIAWVFRKERERNPALQEMNRVLTRLLK